MSAHCFLGRKNLEGLNFCMPKSLLIVGKTGNRDPGVGKHFGHLSPQIPRTEDRDLPVPREMFPQRVLLVEMYAVGSFQQTI